MKMIRWCIVLFLLVFAFTYSSAQTNFRTTDRWLALIDYSGISYEKLKSVAPHFPKTEISTDKQYADFKEKMEQWKTKYSKEVEAFLQIPELKKLNPSRVHLGLQKPEETRKFENSYWQWITAAGLGIEEVRTFAPHFPQPKITHDLAASEKIYDAVLQDWMKLYPNELEAMLNHPVLISQNKYYQPVKIDAPVGEPFVLIEVNESFPQKSDYDSGNPEIDLLRYELAVQHWYFKYRPEEYATRYHQGNYHKNIEQKQ
jgi:hypothetical protein